MGSNCTKRNKISVKASGPGGFKVEEVDKEVNQIPSEDRKVLHDKRNSQVKNTLESPTTPLKQGDASQEEDSSGKDEWVDQRYEIDEKAKEILKRELGDKWNKWAYHSGSLYEQLRFYGIFGYTVMYLGESANFEEFSSSAKIEVMLELARLDLRKGTTIPELIFRCCQVFPKKDALEKLLELGKQTQTEKEVAKSVLEFQNDEGYSCLQTTFEMGNGHRKRTDKYPSGPLMHDIEESCFYLIDLAKRFNLDLKKILNHTARDGTTLFSLASIFSETLTRQLLEENVRVNSVDDKFLTPFFRVRRTKKTVLFSMNTTERDFREK